MTAVVYTIGHSNHSIGTFIGLLQRHGVNAIADVRSHPYSRYAPQYLYNNLKMALADAGVAYVFVGQELGARSNNPACYHQGKVQYARLVGEPFFAAGLERVRQGMQRYVVALMCAEKDPLHCHRALLVARHLFDAGVAVAHIHADGSLESHGAFESRLLVACKLPESDLFCGRDELIAQAYLLQAERSAYQDSDMEQTGAVAP